MKNILLCSMLLALFALQAQSLKLVITQDKKNCRYKISEPVNFYLSAVDADGKNISGQKINYRFTGDGGLDTPKNIMLRGIRKKNPDPALMQAAREEAEHIRQFLLGDATPWWADVKDYSKGAPS